MKKCLLWGSGKEFNKLVNLIKYHEIKSDIKVIGITSEDCMLEAYSGYKFINQNDIMPENFDIVIIMSRENQFRQIHSDVIEKGFKDEQIISCNLLGYPWFDFDKYIKLKQSELSIFAVNCWGVLTYNSLNLRFLSPFINLYLQDIDYLKFLNNPKYYIAQEIKYISTGYDGVLEKSFPICSCGDIKLFFNHYDDFESAREYWEKRKVRINWENILVMMYSDKPEILEQFTKLPYKKKICFTTLKYLDPSIHCIEAVESINCIPLWKIVNNFLANNTLCYYDVLDLLLEGKLKRI